MATKLTTPELEPFDEDPLPAQETPRPDLRRPARQPQPRVQELVQPGFVTEAQPFADPPEPTEPITIEIPRQLKKALLDEVTERKHDPDRKKVASIKSIILEALAAHGFAQLIKPSDIAVQSGIWMKRVSNQLRNKRTS